MYAKESLISQTYTTKKIYLMNIEETDEPRKNRNSGRFYSGGSPSKETTGSDLVCRVDKAFINHTEGLCRELYDITVKDKRSVRKKI